MHLSYYTIVTIKEPSMYATMRVVPCIWLLLVQRLGGTSATMHVVPGRRLHGRLPDLYPAIIGELASNI